MLYSINIPDLNTPMPRLLPIPLVTGILHLQAGVQIEKGIAEFIDQTGGAAKIVRHRWYIEVWDSGVAETLAAKGSFICEDGLVVTEALEVDAAYAAVNVGPYLRELAERLFGSEDKYPN